MRGKFLDYFFFIIILPYKHAYGTFWTVPTCVHNIWKFEEKYHCIIPITPSDLLLWSVYYNAHWWVRFLHVNCIHHTCKLHVNCITIHVNWYQNRSVHSPTLGLFDWWKIKSCLGPSQNFFTKGKLLNPFGISW